MAERLTALDRRLLELADIQRGNAEVEARVSVLRQLDAERLDAVRVFAELASTVPPGLRYTAVARRGGVVSVRGTADAESSVSTFMRNLARSARFGAPSLQNIADTADADDRAMFDLSFETTKLADGTLLGLGHGREPAAQTRALTAAMGTAEESAHARE